jgi:hypothetical protein
VAAGYVLVTSYTQLKTNAPAYAIVADEHGAQYVFPPGKERKGIDDARIQRLEKRATKKPTDALSWIKLASQNLGYVTAGAMIEAPTAHEALAAATAALATPADTVAQ